MILNDVHVGVLTRKNRKRVGRGPGSGHGKTSGRGHKGAGSRSGTAARTGFTGGQMPLMRTVAKRGFNNREFADVVSAVNLFMLENKYTDGETVNRETLKTKGLVKGKYDVLKILGTGEIKKKLTVQADAFSKSAMEKITKAGGKAELTIH